MATGVTAFIESLLRSVGMLLGAAEADAAAEGLVVVALALAVVLIVGSWFLRPGALDAFDFGVNHFDHGNSIGGEGSDCGSGDD
jgi:hypothetical protein